jgi:hypothetical protein
MAAARTGRLDPGIFPPQLRYQIDINIDKDYQGNNSCGMVVILAWRGEWPALNRPLPHLI